MEQRPAHSTVDSWVFVDENLDRSGWHPLIQDMYAYWQLIAPAGGLPGRQHFDPLHISPLMSRVWMLDVVRPEMRFRYRLAGTREVQTLGLDPTGKWFDEVHPAFLRNPGIAERYLRTVEAGVPTYRHGNVMFVHDKYHQLVQNLVLPFAKDGRTVDMLMILSVLFRSNGTVV